ncbi:nickel pincer cofactor biosynthesis protein LarC [Paenibacillus sp. GXUN7292]|uniref:nickel pincer cofactor biosynthesis protein LarC n=1 Tax=Paenibacillus sp. GXUN7292 TaxID=3422499 RepID=UPI003D7DE35B
MKTLYLDCISGIAGDMTLSALVDLGADQDYIISHLRSMPIDPFTMEFQEVDRRGITSKWLKLEIEQSHSHDHHHGHSHTHDHDHHHEHSHSHDHDHHHGHSHSHDHHHSHDHEHHQGHSHSHDHDHEHHHGHSHSHDHEHHHEHSHSHDHDHRHEHSHSHDHDHHHGHSHSHDHHHGHSHSHDHDHEHRKAADIIAMIEQSALPARAKERSMAIFQLIAQAEGKIHGISPAEVHFHEVGAMDSIIDVIGVCLALESLDIDQIIVSPVPTGTGRMRMAHGLYPIPAPATAELLRGVPLSAFTAQGELTTPTGAGIVKALAASFGTIPPGTIDRIGYGAGTKNFDHPNVIRAVLMKEEQSEVKQSISTGTEGHAVETVATQFIKSDEASYEMITILEAQVDDTTGELLGYTMERLLEAGALDVYYTPVYMKKNRPGVLITVLCYPKEKQACEQILLAETSTIGVRSSQWQRKALRRQWIEVQTEYGFIKVKQAFDGERLMSQAPEYEEAAKAARLHGVSLDDVYKAIYRSL